MLFVVLDDFLNDEIQKFLGKLRVQIGLSCKLFKACDLHGFTGWISGWQIVLCFELSH